MLSIVVDVTVLLFLFSSSFAYFSIFSPIRSYSSLYRSTPERSNHQRMHHVNLIMSDQEDIMAFGNRMNINIKMPTKDPKVATQFLSHPKRIIEAAWDKEYLKQINTELYMMQFQPVLIPGLGTLNPEIEVKLGFQNGILSLNSGNWTIRGSSGEIMKDSRFLHTFDIKLKGEISVDKTISSGYVIAKGWVDYQVQGAKPTFFRKAPTFLLENTVRFIQHSAQEYATTVFITRYMKAFRDYMRCRPNTNVPLTSPSTPAKESILV